MSDEMVVRVARAMWAAREETLPAFTRVPFDARLTGDIFVMARAAILAMGEPTGDRIRQAVVAMLLDRFSDRYSGDPVMHEPEAQLLAGIVLAALEGGK